MQKKKMESKHVILEFWLYRSARFRRTGNMRNPVLFGKVPLKRPSIPVKSPCPSACETGSIKGLYLRSTGGSVRVSALVGRAWRDADGPRNGSAEQSGCDCASCARCVGIAGGAVACRSCAHRAHRADRANRVRRGTFELH